MHETSGIPKGGHQVRYSRVKSLPSLARVSIFRQQKQCYSYSSIDIQSDSLICFLFDTSNGRDDSINTNYSRKANGSWTPATARTSATANTSTVKTSTRAETPATWQENVIIAHLFFVEKSDCYFSPIRIPDLSVLVR